MLFVSSKKSPQVSEVARKNCFRWPRENQEVEDSFGVTIKYSQATFIMTEPNGRGKLGRIRQEGVILQECSPSHAMFGNL